MTKQQYRNYSYLFFFFSIMSSGFLINAVLTGFGLSRLLSSLLFGVLVIMQLRIALLMRRKSQDLNLK